MRKVFVEFYDGVGISVGECLVLPEGPCCLYVVFVHFPTVF